MWEPSIIVLQPTITSSFSVWPRLISSVLRRAHVPALDASLSQSDVIQAIEDENRVEFAIEPHRWFDLVRTGRAVSVLGISEHQQLFPIPYNDIEADRDLQQNPNY